MRMLSFLWQKRNQQGFTLVELVIVIAVLAILAAIAIPVVSTILSNAKHAALLTDARSIYEQVAIDVERNNKEESALCYYLARPSANFNKALIDGSGRMACRINYYHGQQLKLGDANGNGAAHVDLAKQQINDFFGGDYNYGYRVYIAKNDDGTYEVVCVGVYGRKIEESNWSEAFKPDVCFPEGSYEKYIQK